MLQQACDTITVHPSHPPAIVTNIPEVQSDPVFVKLHSSVSVATYHKAVFFTKTEQVQCKLSASSVVQGFAADLMHAQLDWQMALGL